MTPKESATHAARVRWGDRGPTVRVRIYPVDVPKLDALRGTKTRAQFISDLIAKAG